MNGRYGDNVELQKPDPPGLFTWSQRPSEKRADDKRLAIQCDVAGRPDRSAG